MDDRQFVPRDQWERISPQSLTAAELLDGARRADGPIEAYRVKAAVGPEQQTLELLWVVGSQRAAVASAQGVFWTNAATPEAALQRWAVGTARGERTRPR